LVTVRFGPGRFWHLGDTFASGASMPAPHADGWHSALGRGTVPRLLAQFIFVDECVSVSLHFCVVGTGASEGVRGHTRDESAGRRAKPVCGSAFYCIGAVQTQGWPKLCTSAVALVMRRVSGPIGRMPSGLAWPQSIFAPSAPPCAAGSWLAKQVSAQRACHRMCPWVRSVHLSIEARRRYSSRILLLQICSAHG